MQEQQHVLISAKDIDALKEDGYVVRVNKDSDPETYYWANERLRQTQDPPFSGTSALAWRAAYFSRYPD